MKTFKDKKLILFDLDGVLINSLKNIEISWNTTAKKYLLNKRFIHYKKHIGKPFKVILDSLKIKKNLHKNIENDFRRQSLKNLNLISFYPDVLKVLKYLKKKEYQLGVLTSKDKYRTKIILKKLKIKFNIIQCPEKKIRGKPYPDLILKIIKNLQIFKKDVVYIGDTKFDLMTCRSAKIDFILAKYGFKIGIKNYKSSISKLQDLKKIF